MDDQTVSVFIALIAGVFGYVYRNEKSRSKDQSSIARIEVKLDLIMAYFHLEPKEEGKR